MHIYFSPGEKEKRETELIYLPIYQFCPGGACPAGFTLSSGRP